VRDDEEASVELACSDCELAGRVDPRLRVIEDDRKLALVEVGEESAVGGGDVAGGHRAAAAAPESITS